VFNPNQKLRICLYDIKEGNKVAQINHRLKEIENSKVQVEGVDLELSSFSMQGLNYIGTLGNDLIRNVKFEQNYEKAITLKKSYARLFFKSNGRFYLIFGKNAEFQYIEKNLLFGNEDILVLKKLKHLNLKEIKIVENDTNSRIFNTLKRFADNMKPFLQKEESLLILQNKKIEKITMCHKSDCIYLTPNCKTVKILMQSSSKHSAFKTLAGFLELIPKN
jgi:hypothetical protein